MTKTTLIRSLERRDLPDLVRLCREHAEYEGASWKEYAREERLASLLLDSNDTRCWVVDTPAELAGFASAALELSTWDAGRYLHLDCLYLRPEHRDRGLGRALVGRVARAALELEAVNLQWQTPSWNDGAARFYKRLGATAGEKLRFTLDRQGCRRLFVT